MSSAVHSRHARQIRNDKRMAASNEGPPHEWDDDIRIDQQIEHETEVAVTSYKHYQDLVQHCSGNVGFTNALHNIILAYRELNSRPMDIGENRRFHDEIYSSVEAMSEAFEDVARIRVGEHVERGDSYVYEVER